MGKRILTFVALTFVAAAATAQAQGGGGRGPGGPGRMGGPGGRCAGTADSLTDAQKTQVRSLAEAFTKAHATQLDSLRAIMEAARAARQAGKTPEEIRAIMETGKPIGDALAPARKEYETTVVGLLTSSQIAAGCIPPAPGGPPPGGRGRGGPPRPPSN
jgi:Spy/CpxP family protein refolding chaperone